MSVRNSLSGITAIPVLAIILSGSASAQFTRQAYLATNDALPLVGSSVALSSDGNTAAVGSSGPGGMHIFTRTSGAWTQQGARLSGSDFSGALGLSSQGSAVALSADGNTALMGGPGDNNNQGAAWVFTRTGAVWTQQGAKLVPSDISGAAGFGSAVALSGDGNTAIVGGPNDATNNGAAWVFTRNSSGIWTQLGPKITANDAVFTNDSTPSGVQQGTCVALSADGNTALVGGPMDNALAGADWVYTRVNGAWSQQGAKLVGSGAQGVARQGGSCALSSDGNTAFEVGAGVNVFYSGALWVFTRSSGVWTQQGSKLTATGAISNVAASGDGNTALAASTIPFGANGYLGGTWMFTRNNFPGTNSGTWSLLGRIDDSGQEAPLAISSDGSTALLVGGATGPGQVSVFTRVVAPPSNPLPTSVSPDLLSGLSQTATFSFSDPQGYQNLGVLNILVNNALDARQSCYLAYSQPQNVLYLVADDGIALLPGSALTSSGNISNSQCMVSWGGSPVVVNGTSLSLTLTISFNAAFTGNKVVFMAARDVAQVNSGWQALGVWQVPGAVQSTTTAVLGMSPANAFLGSPPSNTAAAFTFDFSDTKGFQDLGVVNILADSGTGIDGRHACYLAYDRRINALYLVNDNGDALSSGSVLNAASTTPLSNSQCSVSWGATPVVTTGNFLQLTLTIGFKAQATQIFYLAARDANDVNNTGWQTSGIVTFCKGFACLGG
jgi:hypothetical protein